MKIVEPLAEKLVSERYRIVGELSLYIDDSPFALYRALQRSQCANACYMNHVRDVKPISVQKFRSYKSGQLEVPAYVAQSALDAILREGFQPESSMMQRIMIALLLTRRSVTEPAQITSYFPSHWPQKYVDMMVNLAKECVDVV
ncbi:hypothetical protein AB9X29_003716 [Vibrio vulnificus]